MPTQQQTTSKGDNVRVVVRCRPLNEREKLDGCRSIVDCDESTGVVVVRPPGIDVDDAAATLRKSFSYDHVFGPDSKQVDVYNRAVRRIVDNVLQGYNGTVFAYGQTGTGKTYTMEGDRNVAELKGVIPNSFAHIFGYIAKCGDEKTFLVRCSYLEIYNEEIRDLLARNQEHRLEIKERPDIGVYVKDLSSVTVSSADEMDRVMSVGNKNRSVGATNMNEYSSRSHAIFTITLECSEIGADGSAHVRMGKLHLVDLAGSERQSKSGATGQRLKEATKINLSLSTLGNVISALVDSKATHVPYRNSKLTRLLQDSLGGNSRTLMCANIGCADYNHEETVSTLRYASRAKSIVNNARINEDPKDALLRKFQQEIEFLKQQLTEGDEEIQEGSEEEDNEHTPIVDSKKDKRLKKPLSESKMKAIEAEIEQARAKLLAENNMKESERRSLEVDLKQKEEQLKLAREEQESLLKKLNSIEKKVIVGGENLLEKMEEQARLLEESNKELEKRKGEENKLRRALEQKQAERLDIEEKYSTLQEEAQGKTKKLKKVWNMLNSAKAELSDLNAEHQRETESLLDNVRELSRELSAQMLIINSFIPHEYQELIERYVHWNEEIGDWQLKCIAYTGNNMQKSEESQGVKIQLSSPDLSWCYLTYAADDAVSAQWKFDKKVPKKATKKEKEAARLKSLLQ